MVGHAEAGRLHRAVTSHIKTLMARTDPRVTHTELAAWLNMSRPTLLSRMNASTSWRMTELERIAERFGLDVVDLLPEVPPD